MSYGRGALMNWAGGKTFHRKTTHLTLLAIASRVELEGLKGTITVQQVHELAGVPTVRAAAELRHLADLRHITLRPVDGEPGRFAVKLLLGD
jgi:hypothetical protein